MNERQVLILLNVLYFSAAYSYEEVAKIFNTDVNGILEMEEEALLNLKKAFGYNETKEKLRVQYAFEKETAQQRLQGSLRNQHYLRMARMSFEDYIVGNIG
jgi:hypothetical protein